MKIYIAGPMTGLPEFNYPAFDEAEAVLRAAGHEVLNPTSIEQHNDTGETQPWEWYMRHALRMVTEAQGIAMLPKWWFSRGATLEHDVAVRLGLDCRYVDGWLS